MYGVVMVDPTQLDDWLDDVLLDPTVSRQEARLAVAIYETLMRMIGGPYRIRRLPAH